MYYSHRTPTKGNPVSSPEPPVDVNSHVGHAVGCRCRTNCGKPIIIRGEWAKRRPFSPSPNSRFRTRCSPRCRQPVNVSTLWDPGTRTLSTLEYAGQRSESFSALWLWSITSVNVLRSRIFPRTSSPTLLLYLCSPILCSANLRCDQLAVCSASQCTRQIPSRPSFDCIR